MKRTTSNIKLAAMLLLLWAGNTFATSPNSEENNYREIRKAIEKRIPFPEFAKENEGTQKVSVSFQIDENGKITVLSTSGNDTLLNDYVKEKLNDLQIESGKELNGKVINLDIRFRIL